MTSSWRWDDQVGSNEGSPEMNCSEHLLEPVVPTVAVPSEVIPVVAIPNEGPLPRRDRAHAATPPGVSHRAYPPSPPAESSLANAASCPAEKYCGDENAAEVFERAEALCEGQQFEEAAALFRRVLAALQGNPDRKLRAVEAEVWAHLGVTMQSLDDIEAAIESYDHAVQLDPSLHVCFANLATLYVYLEDSTHAHENIARALNLEPTNQAYLDIQRALPPLGHDAWGRDGRLQTTCISAC